MNRCRSIWFGIISSSLAGIAMAGLPEPGIVLYGNVVYPNGGLVPNGGELKIVYTKDSGTTNTVTTTGTIQSNGGVNFVIQLPAESPTGGAVTQGKLEANATSVAYRRTCFLNNSPMTFKTGLATDTFYAAERGKVTSVTLEKPACSINAAPPTATVAATASTGSFNVTSNGCDWTAAEALSWVTLTGVSSGNGNATVSYSYTANNTGAQRSGVITVTGGANHTITQLPGAVAPPNDNFASRQLITGAGGATSGTIVNATVEAGEPLHGGSANARSVWYSWTAPTTCTVNFSAAATSGFNPKIAIYTGTVLNGLSPVASAFGASTQTTASLMAGAGKVYVGSPGTELEFAL